MAPLVRRSWNPCGQTPVLKHRTRSHRKVSIMGALCISPDRTQVHLYFRLHPDHNINATRVRDFLRQLEYQLAAPLILIWDRLQAHRSRLVQRHITRRRRLRSVFLPPYAPELNPVEYAWAQLKHHALANRVCLSTDELATTARHATRSLQRRSSLLRAFVQHSPLFLRLR